MKEKIIEIKNLHVSFNKKQILNGINLTIYEGEIHAIMGPNGAGKSTLTHVICADPSYKVLSGAIYFKGENILKLSPEERSKLGIFASFQNQLRSTFTEKP